MAVGAGIEITGATRVGADTGLRVEVGFGIATYAAGRLGVEITAMAGALPPLGDNDEVALYSEETYLGSLSLSPFYHLLLQKGSRRVISATSTWT